MIIVSRVLPVPKDKQKEVEYNKVKNIESYPDKFVLDLTLSIVKTTSSYDEALKVMTNNNLHKCIDCFQKLIDDKIL